MERKIGIVGAGVSGLLACKYALFKGYHPIVFESQSNVGGVWTKTLEITKLQTAKSHYQFSDFPWPSSVETLFPNQHQVLEYLQSYAKHFNLLKHIRFNTKVVSIDYEGQSVDEIQSWVLWGGNGDPFGNKGKWTLTTHNLLSQSTEVIQVDFVILGVGRFSDLPNMPKFPSDRGPEVFNGEVMHSMEYSALDYQSARNMVKGKRVVVVGSGKTAIDIATQCSIVNGVEHPCIIVSRTPRWNTTGTFSYVKLYGNRFSELLLHKPGEGPLLYLLASLLSPLRWGISKFIEKHIKKEQPLKKFDMVPNHSFLQEMNSCSVSTIPNGFYDNMEKGSIIFKRSQNFNFYKEGVEIDNSDRPMELINCDLVIFATGFKGDKKIKDIFASPKFECFNFNAPEQKVALYRGCVHPRIPQAAVIGFPESTSLLFSTEFMCRWLFDLLDGKFKLPSIQEMEKDIFEWDKFMTKYAGKYNRISCFGAILIWYLDQLCKDLGLNPKRKNTLWAELFEPYTDLDYA